MPNKSLKRRDAWGINGTSHLLFTALPGGGKDNGSDFCWQFQKKDDNLKNIEGGCKMNLTEEIIQHVKTLPEPLNGIKGTVLFI